MPSAHMLWVGRCQLLPQWRNLAESSGERHRGSQNSFHVWGGCGGSLSGRDPPLPRVCPHPCTIFLCQLSSLGDILRSGQRPCDLGLTCPQSGPAQEHWKRVRKIEERSLGPLPSRDDRGTCYLPRPLTPPSQPCPHLLLCPLPGPTPPPDSTQLGEEPQGR